MTKFGELRDTVNKDVEESFEYARYWHGYLVFLRPALVIFNIGQIRTILIVTFIMLLIIFMAVLIKNIGVLYGILIALRNIRS